MSFIKDIITDEVVAALQLLQTPKSKHSLGKIVSKYLIFEILGFSGYSSECANLQYDASKKRREMLLRDYKIFKVRTIQIQTFELIFDRETCFLINGLTTAALSEERIVVKIRHDKQLHSLLVLKRFNPKFDRIHTVEIEPLIEVNF